MRFDVEFHTLLAHAAQNPLRVTLHGALRASSGVKPARRPDPVPAGPELPDTPSPAETR
ncbi:hypothetical protein EBESD8_22440 [Rhodococcus aetherivorans]|nr:hypothetical protein EBESD8_22440 [Rhodococcus aetherivorans]